MNEQAMQDRQNETEERVNALEDVQANLVNQVAEVENAATKVDAPGLSLNEMLQNSSKRSEEREREQIKRDLEAVQIQQQVDVARRNAEQAFGKANK